MEHLELSVEDTNSAALIAKL